MHKLATWQVVSTEHCKQLHSTYKYTSTRLPNVSGSGAAGGNGSQMIVPRVNSKQISSEC